MRTPHNERLGSDITDDGPERTCILSGQKAARDALVRLAVSPDGEVLPDALAKAPGRGAWLGVSRAALETALAKGKFSGAMKRAFKGAPITISEDLPERIEAALKRAVTDRLGLELRAGKPRAEALRNLADRTGVDDLSSLVTMLIQTDKFGTSVAQSLRVYSETLRTKRRQRAEEAAAKTGVKMVFPLVFCIFPAIWVVTIGPAAIRFMTVLFPMIDNMKK